MYFSYIVDCEWDSWPENWTECSESCGGGLQRKTRRKKIEAQHNGKDCQENSVIVQQCNMNNCTDGKSNDRKFK